MENERIEWVKKGVRGADDVSKDIVGAVGKIIRDVRERGTEAVAEYSRKFDDFGGPFAVPFEEAESALRSLLGEERVALEEAIRNVRRFHALQREILKDREWEISPGVCAGFRYIPVDSAAVYIPGGRYPLVSSAIMCVVPAQEAGVKRIAAVSPPGRGGRIHPSVLAALALLGVEEIWAIGGVQAIAAVALGTREIRKVDFVAGPGNAYVAEAKRALFGEIGIDGLAGPSEVLILADEGAVPRLIASDMLAQSEHDPMARAVLVTTSATLAGEVMENLTTMLACLPTKEVAGASWEANGAVGIAATLDDAIAYANRFAPEHLQLALANPREALSRCTAYGAAFLGYSSSEVFGDYIAGTNHTLPTEARAKFSSGLWTGSFMKISTHLDLTPEGADALSGPGSLIARTEGLEAHARALLARKRD